MANHNLDMHDYIFIYRFDYFIIHSALFGAGVRFIMLIRRIQAKENTLNMPDQFLSFHDAVDSAERLARMVNPKDYDVVCGIPRGGLFIANVVACQLGLPLAVPEMLENRIAWQSANVTEFQSPFTAFDWHSEPLRILLIDDTVKSGKRYTVAMQHLYRHTVTFAVAYECQNAKVKPEIAVKRLDNPTAFQWDLMTWHFGSHRILSDIDGVICEDYRKPRDYAEFILCAKPLFIPKFAIDTLFTARPVRCRVETEDYLRRMGVSYNRLFMYPGVHEPMGVHPSKEQILHFKVNVAEIIRPRWIWESDAYLARGLYESTGITTLCFDTWELHTKGDTV